MLRLAQAMGSQPKRVLIVGCEPASFGEEDGGRMGLSPAVEAVVDAAVALVEAVVADVLTVLEDEAQSAAGQPATAAGN